MIVLDAETRDSSLVTVRGRQYLGSSATYEDIKTIPNPRGIKIGDVKISGCAVSLCTLYNAVQREGGWLKVCLFDGGVGWWVEGW